MRKFRSHLLGVAQGSELLFSDFEHDGEMWTGSGPREFRLAVKFPESYARPPVVHVSISMWDMDAGFNQRADISAENIGRDGFDIVFRTWQDSRVARIRADWTALGEVDDDEAWEL